MNIGITEDGRLEAILLEDVGDWDRVLFRTDRFGGPAWTIDGQAIPLSRDDTKHLTYTGNHGGLILGLQYFVLPDRVEVRATISNTGTKPAVGIKAGIQLGIDTYMDKYPEWDHKLFPTMLRCEKTHCWGYFMGPAGQILLVTVPEPVASYHLHYKPGLHRIYTATLDLMHPSPLPERHPVGLDTLVPGEEKTWTLAFTPLSRLEDVKPAAARLTNAPMIDLDLYTIAEEETFSGRVFCGSSPLRELTVMPPNGAESRLSFTSDTGSGHTFFYTPPAGTGVHKITATSGSDSSSEALLAVRHPWSWYLAKARENAVTQEQKASSHTESWYGLFSAYLARRHFPDQDVDDAIDDKFNEIWPLMYDMQAMQPLSDFNRIQNHACAAGLLADKYQASRNIADLKFAASLADFVIKTQKEDGGYYAGGKTHYTSVIYIAKSIMEVVDEEMRLGETDPEWKERARMHLASVKRAIDDLCKRRDDVQTEGEMTYEDGMIACSYSQLAMYALWHASGHEPQAYVDAALYLANGHRCLSQLIIPDCRMNGGSLRFWESQYDVLTQPNMMNSPHGWSAWRVYGLWYLYQLTGRETYINQVYNALGACCQLIDFETGELSWGFVADPYVQSDYWEEDPKHPGMGRAVEKILGEQYIPMISGWYKAKPVTKMFAYGRNQDGGCCDNDVHEIFKCLEEVVLTSACVVEDADGNVRGYNCSIVTKGDSIGVIPAERIVNAVHFNLRHRRQVHVEFSGKPTSPRCLIPGMHWVLKAEQPPAGKA